ncbi:hypothetical protein [Heliophilum fasciatum]|uniref:Nucleotide-diphospho-sugar transferase n=1 Tax=Heliophilum fasciatum TaxID=35700 RepID=A0A4R2REM8_9FIRM|nr:hypothetical protein [Heliophilum fasciatum]MCW2279265.1 hypothetical protein [Heliophilum fasciatum]TCP60487.1 hypothetical protein EDD73_13615 [Heliophilum fasciatum]
MRHYYCSTFSKEYAYKGLLLYESIEKHDKEFQFFIICLDEDVKKLFEKMNLAHAVLISMQSIEEDDGELLAVKNTRNVKEYIWTSKGSTFLYLFKHYEIDHLVWLDGDTYFFADPEPIFTEWGQYSIMLTGEHWLEEHKILGETNGFFNTGFMGFKRDAHAMESMVWFRKKLIEWCFDKWENGLWSDQVYVNDWPERFQNVGVIKNMGVNLTPYIINYRLKESVVNKIDDAIFVDDEKIIYFHFYGFKYYDGNVFDICNYVMNSRDEVIRLIYPPYLYAANNMINKIRAIDANLGQVKPTNNNHIRNYLNLQANSSANQDKINICTIISEENLAQGFAIYRSLKKKTSNFQLWVCCMDDASYSGLQTLGDDNVFLIQLKNIEGKQLLSIKDTRTSDEYRRTVKSSLILYILKNNYNVASIMYIEADSAYTGADPVYTEINPVYAEANPLFLCDPQLLSNELKTHSVVLYKRNILADEEKKYGLYDAGFIGFTRDQVAFQCLYQWKKQCIDWCFHTVEEERWLDQKYLDQVPQLFSNIKIMESSGIPGDSTTSVTE